MSFLTYKYKFGIY